MTAEVRGQYVDVPGGQAHLHRCGIGPAVVLLHHAPSSSRCWDAVLPRLAEAGLAAYALDLPGFGSSTPPEVAPDIAWYARWVGHVLDGLSLTGPVILVGRHSGATVAAAAAAVEPERVTRLVLWGYPWLSSTTMDELATEVTPPLSDDLAPLHTMVEELRMLDPVPTPDGEQRRRLGDFLIAGPQQHRLHNAVGRSDHGALAAGMAQPCLFVFDDARTDLTDQNTAGRRSATAAPRGEFRSVPGLSIGDVDHTATDLAALVADIASGRLVPGGTR